MIQVAAGIQPKGIISQSHVLKRKNSLEAGTFRILHFEQAAVPLVVHLYELLALFPPSSPVARGLARDDAEPGSTGTSLCCAIFSLCALATPPHWREERGEGMS